MSIVKEIDAATAHQLLESHQAVAVDVRELEEYNAGHIPGIQFNPLTNFDTGALPTEVQIIVVCRSGSRSYSVCEALLESHPNLVNLSGGMKAWAMLGFMMDSETEIPFVL